MSDKLIPFRIGPDCDPLYVEVMRRIYNLTLPQTATKDTATEKSEEEQQHWFFKVLDHSKTKVHLYRSTERPWHIAAFSMVTDRGPYCTPMFAIHPRAWGKNYGRQVIAHYLEVAGKPLFGEQLKSNAAIKHLNEGFGWVVTHESDTVEYLYNPGVTRSMGDAYAEILAYHGT